MEVQMKLSAAKRTGLKILGTLFIDIFDHRLELTMDQVLSNEEVVQL